MYLCICICVFLYLCGERNARRAVGALCPAYPSCPPFVYTYLCICICVFVYFCICVFLSLCGERNARRAVVALWPAYPSCPPFVYTHFVFVFVYLCICVFVWRKECQACGGCIVTGLLFLPTTTTISALDTKSHGEDIWQALGVECPQVLLLHLKPPPPPPCPMPTLHSLQWPHTWIPGICHLQGEFYTLLHLSGLSIVHSLRRDTMGWKM